MKNKLKKLGTVSALAAMALLPLTVAARTVPASSGRPVVWGDGPCFSMWYSSMTNTCASMKSFELPLPADNAGGKTVYVTAYGASSSNNVGCAALGLNREVTVFWGSARQWLPSFGSSQIITLTGAYVPPAGFLYVNCHVEAGGRVNTVDYNQ